MPSAPLVPKGDPTLLFTNAGMVPFKDYFLGLRTPEVPRVVDCQKCLRISGKHNDLEAVGRDTYHHTFFEMLGNWSFGDYYKKEAVAFHWKLATKIWGIEPSRLWATIYKDDDEAFAVWQTVRELPPGRILRFGEKENFWEMGETGPCGPCSEIHIDRGPEACDGTPHRTASCAVNVEGCARFIELGNLVFIQFNRDAAGKLTPLPKKHVDTGTGLERVAAVLQSLESGRVLGNYDTDLFRTIIGSIEQAAARWGTGVSYGADPVKDISIRAIADHARTICFLIAEGVNPGNTDREYVLRRVLRRAARHGRYLGIDRPFLSTVQEGVIAAMGDAYPELRTEARRTGEVITQEEERFGETLGRGLDLIETQRRRLRASGSTTLDGEVAFRLYDTYGFPLDLTEDLLRDDGITVDVAGFERLMEEQRARGREARKEEGLVPEIKLRAGTQSRFVGYHRLAAQSEVLAAVATDDDRLALVTAETPFYPEGGGQVGDRGTITAPSGALLEVSDTRRRDGTIVHIGRLLRGAAGEFAPGAPVGLEVDQPRREAAMLNHSATHILHYALRDILGQHVRQAGSMVAPDRMRFDFDHHGAISPEQLREIEEEVNARVRENAEVTLEEMAFADALKAGALAFFGDKYGDRVRVVRMGDFSVELCGGTHVNRTGDIGLFKLEAESGIAAGVRRIEASTGQGALQSIQRRERILEEMGSELRATDEAALERLQKLLARQKELEKKLRSLEQRLASGAGGSSESEQVTQVNGFAVVTSLLEGIEPGALRQIADRLRQKHRSAVIVLGSAMDGKAALLVAVTPDLTARIRAGDLIRQLAPIVGGSGGGRPELAQAGGRDPSRLPLALQEAVRLVGG